MPKGYLDNLAKAARDEIKAGDASKKNAEAHYIQAGKYLLRAKKKVGHGGWLEWLEGQRISARTAQDYMAMAEGKVEIDKRRAADRKRWKEKPRRGKSAGAPAHSKETDPGSCDYDWENPSADDFPSPLEMYRRQAERYTSEAAHLGRAYPMKPGRYVKPSDLTRAEIEAVEQVVKTWTDLLEDLKQHYEGGRNETHKKVLKLVPNS